MVVKLSKSSKTLSWIKIKIMDSKKSHIVFRQQDGNPEHDFPVGQIMGVGQSKHSVCAVRRSSKALITWLCANVAMRRTINCQALKNVLALAGIESGCLLHSDLSCLMTWTQDCHVCQECNNVDRTGNQNVEKVWWDSPHCCLGPTILDNSSTHGYHHGCQNCSTSVPKMADAELCLSSLRDARACLLVPRNLDRAATEGEAGQPAWDTSARKDQLFIRHAPHKNWNWIWSISSKLLPECFLWHC